MKVTLNWITVCSADRLTHWQEKLKSKGGIYLWIWRGDPKRIVYIGETADFITRNAEHFRNVLGGYGTYFRNVSENDDFVEIVRKHYAGKVWEELKSGEEVYVPAMPEDINLNDCLPGQDELIRRWRYLYGMDYAFAEIDRPVSRDVRREIEGGLIRDVWEYYCNLVCDGNGSSHGEDPLNRNGARRNQRLIGNINKYPTKNYEIEHTGQVAGIPEELLAIGKILKQ